MYRLFYGDLEIGTITRTGGDFPWNWGKFEQVFDPEASDLTRQIEAYRRMTAQKYPLIEAEEFERLHEIEEKLFQDFSDLIESDQWRLVDGEDSWGIMAPEFPEENIVAWR
ncbi:hypothetical protein [Deinococcus cellulosilyticus]|uniref:Uncharacterized protein n=1 Tax=Deinococcus cellulosilyticus (strain DSM 18568 / NBRC 106333 / KACC 11606 / 5516J-15) TaxID=1223518 RepID=A0A511N7P6_DEIC1|nr:hypothetical protein [Deinococcus cellulosilyticus]GEM48508.1 hypothetical protein DC3_41430 [Deinococcus cellulosilyticus NBRC 106333 = KACC 11606]